MNNTYTAVIKRDGPSWIGWIEEIAGVNCQASTRDKLMESLKKTLREALDFNRQIARFAAGSNFQKEQIDL